MENYEIYLTRGDTLPIKILITDQNKDPYELQEGDILYFTVKKSISTSEIVFQKRLQTNKFNIEHDDTAGIAYGKYVYDVQLTLADGTVWTIIKPNLFEVTGEVTYD